MVLLLLEVVAAVALLLLPFALNGCSCSLAVPEKLSGVCREYDYKYLQKQGTFGTSDC